MDIKDKLYNLIDYLILKGGKKNLSKLIKVKRPFKTKSGKVGYRDTWVLPGQVKHDEKIHNDHKLHHLLPKEHPDYKKKEMHPNFEAGRAKFHEGRRKNPKAEEPNGQVSPREMVEAHERAAKKIIEEAPKKPKKMKEKSLAKQQQKMREAALRVMEMDHNANTVKDFMSQNGDPSFTIGEVKKRLKKHYNMDISHKEIHDAVVHHNKNTPNAYKRIKMSGMHKKNLKDREISLHPAHRDEILESNGLRRLPHALA